jgi:hypothetical protein
MAKTGGLGEVITVQDASASAQTITNDITNWTLSTPRAVQDVTGVDKSANERILLLADISMTYNGVFNYASDMSHEVFATVPSTSVPRVNTLQPTNQTEPNLTFTCIFTDYQLTRAATGELTWQVPGSGSNGAVPTWS